MDPNQIEQAVSQIERSFGLSRLTSGLLVGRGYQTVDQVANYLGHTSEPFDPLSVWGVKAAAERILYALSTGQRILVYGDYDVDGITGASIMYSYLAQYAPGDRHRIDYYVPDRFRDGYGLTIQGVDRLYNEGFEGLVVTVDNGIAAVAPVQRANDLGKFQIVVTDHHELLADGTFPNTWIVNPRINGEYPMMSGAGVAYMVCCALERLWPTPKGTDWLADLAAIGTIADMCPLTSINRPLVRFGLSKMQSGLRTGLYELLLANDFSFETDTINSETIGFKIGPCLNAAGRIDNPMQCVELLITEDGEYAEKISRNLIKLNEERKKISKSAAEEAEELAEKIVADNPDTGVIVISSKEFHGGVVGLAAAKIVEKFHRPTILLHEGEDGKLVGSARSIPGYNVRESLDTAAHLMVKYGGHAGAAGMTLQTENLEALRAQLNDHFARTVGPVVDVKHHPFDRDVPFGMLSVKLVKELRAVFEPCGMGNPFVTFRTKGCLVEDDKLVGKKERVHLKTTLSQGGRRMDGIGFFMDHAYPLPRDREVIVTYNPDNNTFRGRTSVQMKIKEIYAEDPEPVALPPLPPFSAPVMPAPPGGEAPMLGGPRAFQ